MKIYVASSWKHPGHESLVKALRERGYEVYDFRNPAHTGPSAESSDGRGVFAWWQIPDAPRNAYNGQVLETWPMSKLRSVLEHPVANAGFEVDYDALEWCDVLVLLLPCGNDAHLEAGWCMGRKKPVFVYAPPGEQVKPGLMYKLTEVVNGALFDTFEKLSAGLLRAKASLRPASLRPVSLRPANPTGDFAGTCPLCRSPTIAAGGFLLCTSCEHEVSMDP